jgi:hypothetical protein
MLIVIMSSIMLCVFAASWRLAITGDINYESPPAAKHWWIIVSPYWSFFLIALVPMWLGQYGRGEISPLPWAAFEQEAMRHGLASGLFAATMSVTAILWMLWIPAHIYITNNPDVDREKKLFARLLNVAAGLLLMTPWNPVYRLVAGNP